MKGLLKSLRNLHKKKGLEKISLGENIKLDQMEADSLMEGILYAESYKDWLDEGRHYDGRLRYIKPQELEEFDLQPIEITAREIFASLDRYNETRDKRFAETMLTYLFFFGDNAKVKKDGFQKYESKNSSYRVEIGPNSSGLIGEGYGGFREWINIDSYVMAGRLAKQLGSEELSKEAFRKGYDVGRKLQERLGIFFLGPMSVGVRIIDELHPHITKRLTECATGVGLEDAEKLTQEYDKIRDEKLKENYDLASATRINPTKINFQFG